MGTGHRRASRAVATQADNPTGPVTLSAALTSAGGTTSRKATALDLSRAISADLADLDDEEWVGPTHTNCAARAQTARHHRQSRRPRLVYARRGTHVPFLSGGAEGMPEDRPRRVPQMSTVRDGGRKQSGVVKNSFTLSFHFTSVFLFCFPFTSSARPCICWFGMGRMTSRQRSVYVCGALSSGLRRSVIPLRVVREILPCAIRPNTQWMGLSQAFDRASCPSCGGEYGKRSMKVVPLYRFILLYDTYARHSPPNTWDHFTRWPLVR
ncbi:hypothetical protein V8E53_007494 [Lactarius tabidus]